MMLMAAGMPEDMRRMAVVSSAAHLAVLAMVAAMPLLKVPSQSMTSYQVMLVSPAAREPVVQAPLVPAPPPVPTATQEPVSAKEQATGDLQDILKRADKSLTKSVPAPGSPPALSGPSTKPVAETSEEIARLLSQLPDPSPAPQPSRPPAVAVVPQGSRAVSRAVTVERCPTKAQHYCPLLEAAINRAWNADTNPEVRQVLENAGDATTTVRILIHPDGAIGELRVLTSSGNAPYDRAVQSVLRGLKRVPPLPAPMQGEPFVAITGFTYTKRPDS